MLFTLSKPQFYKLREGVTAGQRTYPHSESVNIKSVYVISPHILCLLKGVLSLINFEKKL